jgi:ABC-2 type transport system ATP-binding protein
MIELINVNKRFGKVNALNNFNLKIDEGKIIGLLAPNGSGKSTCLKIIAGLNQPDSGDVLIFGEKPKVEMKQQIAYLPEVDYLPNHMNVKDFKNFIVPFYTDFNLEKYQDLLNFLELKEDMVIGKISKGMRAKVKLLFTFSREAKIVLLDEPLSGIDVLTRDKIIETIVRDYKAGEQTILLSTHEIDETENIIEDVVFMNDGAVILTENVEDLKEKYNLSLVKIMKEVYRNVL